MIAFFGAGLLGSGFIRAALARSEAVNVWNRTPEKARGLEADGAKLFGAPADAARGCDRVHLVLSDDAAVDETLERARPALEKDIIVVDHTTTSPVGTKARAERWAARGIAFQHAPVFMGPQNARESTGIMLASGEKARFDALSPVLSKMTSKLVYLGPEPERAAGFKLLGNLFLMFMTTGVAEMLTLAKALGISPPDAISLFEHFNPGQSLGVRAKRMIDGDFAHPSWELAMARKDARLMMDAATLAVLPAIAAEMDRFIARGHAHDDWSVIAKDALAK